MGQLKHVVAAIALIAAIILPQAVAAQPASASGDADRAYLVILEDETDPNWVNQIIQYVFGEVVQEYDNAFTGATVMLTADEAEELGEKSEVKSVFEEIEFSVDAQITPTGVRRIDTPNIDGAGANTPIHVAVIDTGIDLDHPDLNVGSGVNCINPSAAPNDEHGHGTHVAGTVAALDNNLGVVGVAPGAVVHPVKVLAYDGRSRAGSLPCGLEWVLDHADTIDVVNMSLGGVKWGRDEDNCGLGNGDGLHQQICALVDAGVTVVVAAGNENQPTTHTYPARYREAITVSALVDSDGLAGGNGPTTSRGPDDTMANFSNYGAHVDVIAPGVNILSSIPGGNYTYLSGTSMASPLVAGAAALYLAQNPGASPAQVDSALKSTGSYDWSGDKDPWKEPLINAAELLGDAPPPPAATIDAEVVSASASPTTITQNSGDITITASIRNNGDDAAAIRVSISGPGGYSASTTTGTLASGQSQEVEFTWPASIVGSHTFQVAANLAGDDNAANDSHTTNSVTVNAPDGGGGGPDVFVERVDTLDRGGRALYFMVYLGADGGASTDGAEIEVIIDGPNGPDNRTATVAPRRGYALVLLTFPPSGAYTMTVTDITLPGFVYESERDTDNPTTVDFVSSVN